MMANGNLNDGGKAGKWLRKFEAAGPARAPKDQHFASSLRWEEEEQRLEPRALLPIPIVQSP